LLYFAPLPHEFQDCQNKDYAANDKKNWDKKKDKRAKERMALGKAGVVTEKDYYPDEHKNYTGGSGEPVIKDTSQVFQTVLRSVMAASKSNFSHNINTHLQVWEYVNIRKF